MLLGVRRRPRGKLGCGVYGRGIRRGHWGPLEANVVLQLAGYRRRDSVEGGVSRSGCHLLPKAVIHYCVVLLLCALATLIGSTQYEVMLL